MIYDKSFFSKFISGASTTTWNKKLAKKVIKKKPRNKRVDVKSPMCGGLTK